MEHPDSLKRIINCAFNTSITNYDMDMIEICLSEGAIITLESIINLQGIISFRYVIPIDPDRIGKCKKIFESILLKNGFEIMIDNTEFMYTCVMHDDEYFIKSIIELGYNGNHANASEVFKCVISDDVPLDHLKRLLDIGFGQYVQSSLMCCVTYGDVECLSLFIEYGANFYSILHELHAYVLLNQSQLWCRIDNINFVLCNMYKIEMLHEPILKYFLIKSI